MLEFVTAHAEKGAGTKTTLYVGQEEAEEVEEEVEEVEEVGAGRGKEKPHNPLMISVQKVRIRPGKGKGKLDGWFPQPLTHNTRRVCTDDPVGCSVLGRGAEPPQFWVLLIWLEPGISHVTWVHHDATMCLPCFVCSILPVLHFLRFDLCVL